jgi:DNA-binding CsgD family transcriptional regulator
VQQEVHAVRSAHPEEHHYEEEGMDTKKVENRNFLARASRSVDAATSRNAPRIQKPVRPGNGSVASRRASTTAPRVTRVALTSREHQALRLIAMGYRADEVGLHLGITTHTVRAHVKHVRYKLSAASTMQAVFTAQKLGMI